MIHFRGAVKSSWRKRVVPLDSEAARRFDALCLYLDANPDVEWLLFVAALQRDGGAPPWLPLLEYLRSDEFRMNAYQWIGDREQSDYAFAALAPVIEWIEESPDLSTPIRKALVDSAAIFTRSRPSLD